MSAPKTALPLFGGFGIELEYMIVDSTTLNVAPVADKLMYEVTKDYSGDVIRPEISWSNELVAHVLELKTSGPAKRLADLDQLFSREISDINQRLNATGHSLLPTAMHPWMLPERDTVLWQHDNNEVYSAYDRIFSCKGHGWSNLQSMHINLPFADDAEFGRLHAAIRMVLPLLPAIAASSPVAEKKFTEHKDARLNFYRMNQARVPEIAGDIIPENVFSRADYSEHIYKPIYRAIAPHDRDNILQHEWLNSRGAIARFDRNAIEIRLIDVQECPKADIAIAALVVAIIRSFVEEHQVPFIEQKKWEAKRLRNILNSTIRDAESAIIDDQEYLATMLGTSKAQPNTKLKAGEIWQELFEKAIAAGDSATLHYSATLKAMLERGSLANAIGRFLGGNGSESKPGSLVNSDRLHSCWEQLRCCLADNKLFGLK